MHIKYGRTENEILPRDTKNFGFAMGIEFREASLSIGPQCEAIARKGK